MFHCLSVMLTEVGEAKKGTTSVDKTSETSSKAKSLSPSVCFLSSNIFIYVKT